MADNIQVAFPYGVDSLGRTATVDEDAHIRDLIEQVLFTSPGERVNRPTFGSGLLQMVFAPTSPELAGSVQFMVQGALQLWLGDRIQVNSVTVDSDDSTVRVEVKYTRRVNGQTTAATFTRNL